ncbi:MAG: LamG-like jellyroll fold domain-containing protein, partial [Armatimonadota bacterium]
GSLEHTLFNIGPIRPDYPYLSNHSSLTISHTADGYLACIISNSRYEPRTVHASIRDWRGGQWHHVALQWKLDDGGKTSMALFIDGKLASDRCMGSAKSPNTQPLELRELHLPIQIGSMNTGFRPADADIDELRISSVRRYSGPFTPPKRFEPDPQTLTLFHFDGSLTAALPKGVTATPGPAQ